MVVVFGERRCGVIAPSPEILNLSEHDRGSVFYVSIFESCKLAASLL